MFKRIFSLVLTVVILVSYNFNIFSAYGEEQDALLIQIPILSNEIDEKYLTGYLFNDSECFVSIDDICRLTRSTYEISNDNIIIKQGIMSVTLDVKNNAIKLEEQDIECKIKEYNGTYLLKPYSILKLLCADCKYNSECKIFTIRMPQTTIYEAIDWDLYNDVYYYFGNEKFSTQFIAMGGSVFMDLLSRGTGAISFLYTKDANEYIDNSLYEISKVNIDDYPSVKKSCDDVLNERMYIAEETLKISNNVNGIFKDMLKCDNTLNELSSSIKKIKKVSEVVSLIKSAEEKINRDLDSYLLLKRTLTHENLDELNMDLYITDRAEYVSRVMESRVSAYLNTGEDKVQEYLFDKGLDIIVKNSDKINKTNISNFLIAYDIGVSVTKLFMNDTFEAYKSNLNAIYLSETQNNTLVIALKLCDINRKENFNNPTNVKRLLDILNLYDRVTIAMYENLKKANNEFNSYDKEFSNSFDDFCNKSADNAYKLSLCEPENDVCSLKDFLEYYKNDIFDEQCNNIITFPTSNYEWHLAPIIEAEDIILSDKEEIQEGNLQNYKYASSEYAIIKNNSQYGIINHNGKFISDMKYNYFSMPYNKEIWLLNENSHENPDDVIITANENSPDVNFNLATSVGFMDYYYTYSKDKNKLFIDGHDFESYFNFEYNVVVEQSEKEYINSQNKNALYGIANKDGIIIPCEYENACMNIGNNIIALEKNGKWGFFNKNGTKIIDFICEPFESKVLDDSWRKASWDNGEIYPYLATNGYIPVKINGKCGYYDTQGNEVIPCGTFEEVRPVHNGLAWVKKDGKWGVIKLKDIEPTANYIAVDLIDKTIPEIIDIMNGKYQIIKTENDSFIYIQNQSVLSGMEFYVQVSGDDIISANNGEEIHSDTLKAKLESGELTLDGIQVNKSGKVSETIQADMDYKSCSKVLGDFNCIGGTGGYLGGDVSSLSYDYNDNHAKVILNFNIPDEIYKDLSLGKISSVSSEEMKSYNPNLRNAVIRKTNEDNSENQEVLFTGTVNTEKDPLNVRKSPSANAEIIGQIEKGSTVTVYSESGDWYEIEYNGSSGYVSKKYIKSKGNNSDTQTSNISDNEILKAVNKYLEENQSNLGVWLSDSDPYCPAEHMYSNSTNWSCPINLNWESYSANEIAGAYPHFAYVDKETLKCTLTANYETVVEFDLRDYTITGNSPWTSEQIINSVNAYLKEKWCGENQYYCFEEDLIDHKGYLWVCIRWDGSNSANVITGSDCKINKETGEVEISFNGEPYEWFNLKDYQ